MPRWANSTGGAPYSFSKAHLAPRLSANHHSASRTLTTNQPSLTGVSPDPESSSRASCIGRDSRTSHRPVAVDAGSLGSSRGAMETRSVGTTGLEISTIGLGRFERRGGGDWHGEPTLPEAVATVAAAQQAGINWLDTAEAYDDTR